MSTDHSTRLERAHVPPSLIIKQLQKSVMRPRTLVSAGFSAITFMLVALAVVPLFSVLIMLIYRGVGAFSWEFFTATSPVVMSEGGGIGNAIVGSLVMVLIAAMFSIPFGILTAIYLAEVGPTTRIAGAVRFCAKVLTGLPSIIAGVFIFGLLVLTMKSFSAWAGGVALSILMLPMIMLTAEDALKSVPAKMREAAYGMGCTRAQVILRVLLPTAIPGILTGVMLSLARALGETAPLILTASYAPQSWVWESRLRLNDSTQSLAMFIFENATMWDENLKRMAWGAALVLVLLVLAFNVSGQLISWRTGRHSQR